MDDDGVERRVRVAAGAVTLEGDLHIPAPARGVAVRPRQREQPSQPAQPVRGTAPERGAARHPARRPAHSRRGGRRFADGGQDVAVLELNRRALALLRVEKRLVIVPGATHLFEEPGTLDEVARLAREWFERHLTAAALRPTGTGLP